MIIAGLRPCSFVDYPGRLAAVVFTHGCNLRCRYCHNPELVSGPPRHRIAEDEVVALLDRRRGKLDGLVISGGEPTLQRDLAAFLARVKAMGFQVKLDTNGTRPEVVEGLLAARLVDFLAIDLKATPEEAGWLCGSVEQPAGARRCLALALAAGVAHEVRTTVMAPIHTAAHLDALAPWAAGAERWVLQRFRPGGHLDASAGLEVPDEAVFDRSDASSR
ncbi:MAG TPA: anaerobic ribonucleoside-triphosphate reductase activating protein [Anaeromyxobacteraceae bacterium]|nr:anaerobic ribonucleoside-triphosphate reductase activating protein [Anaeromyxobacteraceae bacterium]